ncbi:hypothetical protein [Halobacillus litoralis]|uniref:hypothetical protein n=1 Tax=Halobacillus litoralis TaxID=45668 RepID=UPI001CD7B9DF|nr:hypothetical protein [Halobacillus litoralis]MCA1023676.1 hypothetical protein [Halobacillus litoralis]
MSPSQLFIAGTLILIAVVSLMLAKKYHSLLHHTHRMVLSMFSGTSVGLCIGVFFGTHLQGNLYLSTMLGLSAGALLGGLCGWNLGITAGTEGAISGLMGGMMGAMLGEMLSDYESLLLVNFSLSLSMCSLFLYPVFKNLRCHNQVVPSLKWFLKPMALFLFVLCFLLAGSMLIDEPLNNTNPPPHHPSE